MEYLHSAVKRDEILPFATAWMELEGIVLTDICQPGKHRHHLQVTVTPPAPGTPAQGLQSRHRAQSTPMPPRLAFLQCKVGFTLTSNINL